ncbi:hypothetical protein [Mesorhizobium sp. Mes31]|uniref:hypothetical protein n=1 Tax=Mesorhizobium sp. Mes31 TaxID=2926017 RepID=UPI0019D8EF4D|nr:hypothetical protein [Mesorhizobium sp. Mes31]MBE0703770.1 hypothetical protein [Afipia sp.]
MTGFDCVICSSDMAKAVLSTCAAPGAFLKARLSVISEPQQVRRFKDEMIAETAAMHHRGGCTGMN